MKTFEPRLHWIVTAYLLLLAVLWRAYVFVSKLP